MSDSVKKYKEMQEDEIGKRRTSCGLIKEFDSDGNWVNTKVVGGEIIERDSVLNPRKEYPMYSGLLKYFPNALREVSHCSWVGQQQHNPDKPLAWDRSKSGDELDAMLRHLTDHAKGVEIDEDGVYHLVKCCWRILGMTEKFLEKKYEQG